jgi:hypothetical protein
MSGPRPDQRAEQWRGDPDPANQQKHPIDITDSVGLYVRKEYDAQWQLVDFALCQQIRLGGVWEDVMRVDCEHGTVHVHRFTRRGEEHREDLFGISSQGDVDRGWEIAETLINPEVWEPNERRWRDG